MHPSRLSPEQLQRLAIHVVAGGDRHTLQAAAVAEGKTIQTLAAIASLIMSNGIHRVDPVEDDATRAAGLTVELIPDYRAVLVTPRDGPLTLRSLKQAETHTLPDGGVLVRLDTDDVYVADGDRGLLAFGVEGGTLETRRADNPGAALADVAGAVEPLADIAPIAGLREALTDDAQRDIFDQYIERASTWGNVCAGAVVGRHSLLDADPDVVDLRVALPRRQARAWSPAQRRTVHDLALASVARLFEQLDELAEDLTTREADDLDEEALDRIDAVCRAREELEAVAALLAEAQASDRLPRALDLLDERGEQVAAGFPLLHEDDVDDVVVAGARLGSDRWWTRHIEER
jgi:hypothetical protein